MDEKDVAEMQDQSPIEEVALTVPTTDDPTLPVMTFRMWVLGLLCCITLAVLNQFFYYRSNPLAISAFSAQIAVLPLGHLMAKILPTRQFRFPFTQWRFSLNPGAFNIKEHVLITVFANAGAGGVTAVSILTVVRAFYKKPIHFVAALLLSVTTQVLGFGWAGIFRRILVDASSMWWPSNLVQVSLFRALHEKEKRPKRGVTRMQFFVMAMIASFAYYTVPSLLFPSVSALSVACWIWKDSVTAQQLGSGVKGLGIGAVALDWTVVSAYLKSPLGTPWFSIANVMAGFGLVVYVLVPLAYWADLFHARSFPIFSADLFTRHGLPYNTSRILTPDFAFDAAAYQEYGPIHMSVFFAFTYALSFAAISATVSHVLIFHGKDIWKSTKAAVVEEEEDVHTRLMKKNYKAVPQWWFGVLLVVTIAVSVTTCRTFVSELQLPSWAVLLACLLAVSCTLPIGILTATTNMAPGMKIVNEYVIGYMYPGRPVANVIFKTYGYSTMQQAVLFLADLKLGHYMKIPPRTMFAAQLAGTVVAALAYEGAAWWLLGSVPGICTVPAGSPWTCPYDRVFYSASVLWGVVGPRRVFGGAGPYRSLNWFFAGGAVAPAAVWAAARKFPKATWLRRVNVPVVIAATAMMPPATALNYLSWGAVGFAFNFVVFRRRKKWWARHNYALSAALDAGVAFSAALAYVALRLPQAEMRSSSTVAWWGGAATDDHCPLASCPAAGGGGGGGRCP